MGPSKSKWFILRQQECAQWTEWKSCYVTRCPVRKVQIFKLEKSVQSVNGSSSRDHEYNSINRIIMVHPLARMTWSLLWILMVSSVLLWIKVLDGGGWRGLWRLR